MVPSSLHHGGALAHSHFIYPRGELQRSLAQSVLITYLSSFFIFLNEHDIYTRVYVTSLQNTSKTHAYGSFKRLLVIPSLLRNKPCAVQRRRREIHP